VVRSLLRLHEGRVADAEADARAVLETLEANGGHAAAAPPALAVVIDALVERGLTDAADSELRAAGLREDLPTGAPFSRLRHARGRLRLAQGRWERALADARAVGHSDELGGALNPGARWRSVAALACQGAGRMKDAAALADEQVTIARAWGARSFLGEALRVRALVGDPGETLERLQEAVATLAGSPARLDHACALVDLGAALRREGQRGKSRHALEQALAGLDGCGADALVARAGSELEAMGDRPRPRTHAGRDTLTPAERRVAALASRRMSNRQIAQALFLTPKTVENHLGRIYHKLGIHTRGELPNALAD
jgi:DNA-binding CsgD family transcriptional regulator